MYLNLLYSDKLKKAYYARIKMKNDLNNPLVYIAS